MECAEDATKNSRARVPATAKPFCKANNSAPQRKNVRPSQDLWAWVYLHMYFSSHPRLVPKRSVRSHGSVIGGLDLWPAGQQPQRRQASYRRKPVSQRSMFRLFAVRKAACRQIPRRVNFRSVVRSYLVQRVIRICIPPAALPQRRFSYTPAHKSWLTVL
jgi:hypothetical protein